MREWPDSQAMSAAARPGLFLSGGQWLRRLDTSLVGAGNTSLEVSPAGVPGEPQPGLRYLIRQHGILILEWVYLENLVADGVSEFFFIAVPLPICGATGSLVRPLAIG